MKALSFLVHWNKSLTETEDAAAQLYEKLQETDRQEINGKEILFLQMSQEEPISVGRDENGINEYVVECLLYYKNEEEQEDELCQKQ